MEISQGTATSFLEHRPIENLSGFVHDLDVLPRLYAELAHQLAVTRTAGEPARGSRTPGIPLNTKVVEVRDDIRSVLSSWAGLVAESRGMAPPRRAVPELAAFLRSNADWLVEHEAGEDAVREIRTLVAAARRVLDGAAVKRLPVGPCVQPRCPGMLTAMILPSGRRDESAIICSADAAHTWSPEDWHALRSARPASGEACASGLTAADIAAGWRLPPGTVYWLAKIHRWRRFRRGRRVYYDRDDVIRTMTSKTAAADTRPISEAAGS